MAVHYKFKSAKEFDRISIEGHFISIAQLKERIVEKMKLGRTPDFDLLISNAQTGEEYVDEGFLVPRNTSVLVRRVPGAVRMRYNTEVKPDLKVEEVTSANKTVVKPNTNNDWNDDFGVDLYEQPETSKVQSMQSTMLPPPSNDRMDEEAKIKAFCDSSASDWQRQTQEAAFAPAGRGFGRGRGGPGRGGPIGFPRKTPPEGYVCHRCHHPGHYIQHCPTNGDPAYNVKKVKLPTGIPRTMLVPNPDGPYAMPNGEGAVLRPNEDVFEKEVNALTASKSVSEVPQELRCPLCGDVLKDAVLTSKCCFKSYCDRCIRNEIITKGRCVCGATNVLADDLLPNKTLRDAIDRLLDSNAAASGDNVGSRLNIPDVESAFPGRRVASPTASASLKQSPLVTAVPEVAVPSVGVPNVTAPLADGPGAEGESAAKDVESGTKVDEETQQQQQAAAGKKNKPKRPRPPKQGQQMPWRGMEGMEDGHMMPYPGFWPPPAMSEGYMPMGENYMMGYGGPYNGYGGPFDMYNGGAPIMPDPYAYQGMMAPVPPYPQRDLHGGPGFDYDYGASKTREDFDAKKAEARRKSDHHGRERERDRERDHSRERAADERESSGKVDQDSSRSRKRSRDEYSHRDDYGHHRDRDDYGHHRERERDRERERERERDRDRRESSRDRRGRHDDSGHRKNHGDGHSSGEDVSSERHSSRHGRHRSDDYYKSSSSAKAVASAAAVPSSYRSSHDERKRKDEAEHRSSSASKRVSVFLRVKQNGNEEDEISEARRKSSRSSSHRHESNHVEPENETSVLNKFTNSSKSHHYNTGRKQSA